MTSETPARTASWDSTSANSSDSKFRRADALEGYHQAMALSPDKHSRDIYAEVIHLLSGPRPACA